MGEHLVNIFVYGDEIHAYELGYCTYDRSGEDQQLLHFLRSRALTDHKTAIRFPIKEKINGRTFTP